MTTIETYRGSKELFANLTLRELRSKYKRSFLGWAWSLANPFATMAVYTIVFQFFIRNVPQAVHPSGLHIFALFLLSGMLPWNYFSNSVTGCIGAVLGNSQLIKKTYFPRELLPAAAVAAALVSHLIEMGILLVAMLGFGNWRAVEYLPIILLLTVFMSVFSLGFGMIVSSLNVYFRDVQHFMMILLMIWFYLTPILYSVQTIPAGFHQIIKVNPLADAALSYQQVWYAGGHPGWFEMAYFMVASVVLLVVGLVVFARLEPGFAEEL